MILGAVLAGGRSSRFGTDKALALWQGKPLIDHVHDRLRTICSQVIVCGRMYGDYLTVPDRPETDLGPLGGLNAALHFGLAEGFERVISVPCDAPALSEALLEQLAGSEGSAFVLAHPVIGSWKSAMAPLLEELLQSSVDRSMRSWARLSRAKGLTVPAPQNINFPQDLEALDGPR